MTELTIPCHWNYATISQILAQENLANNIRVSEVYGVLAQGGPVGHGRKPDSVAQVTPEEAIDYRRALGELGIRFSYLLNAPFSLRDNPVKKEALDAYLEWVLTEFQPDALTISSYELMRYVRSYDPKIPIHVSTIAGVKTVDDLKLFMDIHPNRLVPHHDVGKQWSDLQALQEYAQEHGVELELMVTESCLYQCPSREAHYRSLGGSGAREDKPFHLTCNSRKLLHPHELLMAGGIIRPEDLELYEQQGVGIFKVTGRSKPAEWLPETVGAYQRRRYDGNLIRLLGIDPSLKAEAWMCLNNRALDGFLTNFPVYGIDEQRRRYCKDWSIKLYQEGNYCLIDGSQYIVEGQVLRLTAQGERVAPIVRRELGI
jgi:collagenase-like PrtC family protease